MAFAQATYIRQSKIDPARPPDWRWKCCCRLYKAKKLLRCKTDPYMFQTIHFIRNFAKAKTYNDFEKLKRDHAIEYAAYVLYKTGKGIKAELEARLLAKEKYEDIAAKIGSAKELVNLYEKVFFNVSDRLNFPGYIYNVIIDPQFSDNALYGLWKFIGYKHGPEAVDWIIYRTNKSASGPFNSKVLADDIYEEFLAKLFMAVRILDVTDASSAKIIRIWGSIAEALNNISSGKRTESYSTAMQEIDNLYYSQLQSPNRTVLSFSDLGLN